MILRRPSYIHMYIGFSTRALYAKRPLLQAPVMNGIETATTKLGLSPHQKVVLTLLSKLHHLLHPVTSVLLLLATAQVEVLPLSAAQFLHQ